MSHKTKLISILLLSLVLSGCNNSNQVVSTENDISYTSALIEENTESIITTVENKDVLTESSNEITTTDNVTTNTSTVTEENTSIEVTTLESKENLDEDTTILAEQTETHDIEEIAEQVYCDVVVNIDVDDINTNWEYDYDYEDSTLYIIQIKNGFYDTFNSFSNTGLDEELELWESTWGVYVESTFALIKEYASNRGFEGEIMYVLEDENQNVYEIVSDDETFSQYISDWLDKKESNTVLGWVQDGVNVYISEDAEIVYDYLGNKALAVCFGISNETSEPINFISVVNATAYQNGIECSDSVVSMDIDTSDQMTHIKDGAKLFVYKLFELQDDYSDVVVEVSPIYSDDVVATRTFTLGE